MDEYQPSDSHPARRSQRPAILFIACILAAALVALTSCSAPSRVKGPTVAERDVALRQIAADYMATGDLAQAEAALSKLDLANPAQLLVSIAEADLTAGKPAEEIVPVARLAEALGARSPRLLAYLAPTVEPSPTPLPPTATAVPPSPTPAPTEAPTETAPTATPAPLSPSPSPTAQTPRVVASSNVNLRSGPGRAYPVIGQLRAGQETAIIARNASGDWWQLAWDGQGQAWVAGTVVNVLGAIDTVQIAQDIPTPPPQPTAAPRPTAAPTQPPKAAGPEFQLIERRLWTLEENGGHLAGTSVNCGDGHLMRVTVLDAAGHRLNGVTVKVLGGNQQEVVTGAQGKGDGIAEFDLYPPGADVQVVRDTDGRAVNSDTAAGPTITSAIPFDILIAAHYCTSADDCNHFVSQNGCTGHYSWYMTFRRAY